MPRPGRVLPARAGKQGCMGCDPNPEKEAVICQVAKVRKTILGSKSSCIEP